MLKSLKSDLNKIIRRLNLFEKITEHKSLERVHHALKDLVGENQAKPVNIKNGVLLIRCRNASTAHYLKMNEDRLKIIANAEKIRYIS